ncbi:MAG: ribonuclease HIII [Planctomycetota bacterium]
MAQRTVVLKLDRAEQERLQREVRSGDFELRSVDHAHFSARTSGVVATLYRSGKLVVQGSGAELFVERYVGRSASAPAAPARSSAPAIEAADGPLIGGDESGKGDYFGPLVVAAVRLEPGDSDRLRAGGVADSKTLSDETAFRVGPALRERFPTAMRVLQPPEYTRRQAAHGNVALLLAELYREVVEEIALPGCAVLIDQFSKNKGRLESVFRDLDVRLFQEHRAERAMAVAAASIVAREGFLTGLRELSDEVGVTLPKGAGPPVLRAGRELLKIHGPDVLDRIAKTHFKTTGKLLG